MAQVFSVNQTPATGAAAVYQLKEALKTAGWTVTASSDGSSYNPTGDEISNGGAGTGGLNNASAWFAIRNPSSSFWMCVQRSTGSAATDWRIKVATSAFSGGSPGAVQVPSSTSESVLLGGGSDSSPTFAALFGATDGTYRYNVMADTAAPHGFYAVGFPSGGGDPCSAFLVDPMASGTYPTSDPYPFVVYIDGNGTGDNLAANVFKFAGAGHALLRNGSARDMVEIAGCRLVQEDDNDTILGPDGAGANPENGADEGLPLIWIRRSGESAPTGLKGWSGFLKITGTSRTTGDTGTVTSAGDRIVFGQVTAPWNGSAPTI